jgi:hypothetical protein
MRKCVRFVILACSLVLTMSCMFAQSTNSAVDTPVEPAGGQPAVVQQDSGRFGFAVKTSLLGIGAEVAARASHRSNVRVGFNVLGYSRTFNKDGIAYDGHLSFRTFEAHYDFFPWARGFHVGPGLLTYLGDPITAHALVPGNQSFTLGGVTYYSDPNAPAFASGRVNFNSVSPMVTVGWGNLVHRDSSHFSVPVELGVAFQGSPKSALNVTGNVCDATGVFCRSVASDSTVQSNIVSEQTKINKNLSPFKAYPIISVGFGYKF